MNTIRRAVLCLALGLLAVPVWADTTSLPLTDDAWINANSPSNNFGASDDIFVHNWGPKHGLVRFDTAPIAGQIVTSATLELYLNSIASSGDIGVYAITSSWHETTVSWNNQPPAESVAIANVSVTIADAGAMVVIDVTGAVQRWADGSLADSGFMIVTGDSIKAFFDTKERSGGVPAILNVQVDDGSGPSPADGKAIVLDFTNPDHCIIDAPGAYVLDRSWDFDAAQTDVVCTQLEITARPVNLDLRGFAIDGKPGIDTVVHFSELRDIYIHDGTITGEPIAIRGNDNGEVWLENMRISGAVFAGAGTVTNSKISDGILGLHVCDHGCGCGPITISNNRMTNCGYVSPSGLISGACIYAECGAKLIQDNRLAGGISFGGSGGDMVVGNYIDLFRSDCPVAIEMRGGGATIARNLILDWADHMATGIRIVDSHVGGVILEGNIIRDLGVGIEFTATASSGNFYGNNRVSAKTPFIGTEGQTDWGGNVSF